LCKLHTSNTPVNLARPRSLALWLARHAAATRPKHVTITSLSLYAFLEQIYDLSQSDSKIIRAILDPFLPHVQHREGKREGEGAGDTEEEGASTASSGGAGVPGRSFPVHFCITELAATAPVLALLETLPPGLVTGECTLSLCIFYLVMTDMYSSSLNKSSSSSSSSSAC
jgi:hypothetical protein